MHPESVHIFRKMCFDFVVLFCVAFPLLAINLWVEPVHRGYIQTDTSLMLPYKGEQVSEEVLAVVGFALNIIIVFVLEIVHSRARGSIMGKRRLFGFNLPVWSWEVYRVLGVFLFGACCQQLTTSTGKKFVGRLRPYFFDVCDPLPADSVEASKVYVEIYSCRSTDQYLLRAMRLSFPSAHSAFSAYASVFFAMYIHKRLIWGSLLLRNGLIFVVALAAWYVGLSRIADHQHHGWDVVAGFLIGTIYAVLVFLYVCHIGRTPERASWQGEENGVRPPVR